MMKLLQIEWMKLRRSATAITILAVYFVAVPLLYWLLSLIALPIADTGIVWTFPEETFKIPMAYHWVTFLGTYFNLMVGVIIIVFTTNEIKYKTQRQNVIDGLNKREIIWAKFIVIIGLSVLVTIYAFLLSLITGLINGSGDSMFEGIEFIGVYFVSTLGYFTFAFLFASLIRLPALATILYLFSTLIEGIATIPVPGYIKEFLPLRSFSELIKAPILPAGASDDRILNQLERCGVAGVYILIFVMITYWVLKRRDI